MKKILLKSVLFLSLFFNLSIVHADELQNKVDKLLPDNQYNMNVEFESDTEVNNYNALPDVSVYQLITATIKTILEWSMILTIMAIVAAGFIYLVSQGKEDSTGKAKDIIINLLIGLAIMASAYAIVFGIAQFNFFEAV